MSQFAQPVDSTRFAASSVIGLKRVYTYTLHQKERTIYCSSLFFRQSKNENTTLLRKTEENNKRSRGHKYTLDNTYKNFEILRVRSS